MAIVVDKILLHVLQMLNDYMHHQALRHLQQNTNIQKIHIVQFEINENLEALKYHQNSIVLEVDILAVHLLKFWQYF